MIRPLARVALETLAWPALCLLGMCLFAWIGLVDRRDWNELRDLGGEGLAQARTLAVQGMEHHLAPPVERALRRAADAIAQWERPSRDGAASIDGRASSPGLQQANLVQRRQTVHQ